MLEYGPAEDEYAHPPRDVPSLSFDRTAAERPATRADVSRCRTGGRVNPDAKGSVRLILDDSEHP